MKKGQVLEGTVEKLKFPNKGIVFVEDVSQSHGQAGCEEMKADAAAGVNTRIDAPVNAGRPENFGKPVNAGRPENFGKPVNARCQERISTTPAAAKKRVVVKNVLPGQKIRFSVSKIRSGNAEGRLLEVLEKSPVEIESPCRHFAECGGCAYQNLPYEEQLKLKEEQVKELLASVLGGGEEATLEQRTSDLALREDAQTDSVAGSSLKSVNGWECSPQKLCKQEYLFEGIKASPVQFSYRNKMEFSFGDSRKGGPLELGMHKRGSFYDIVSVTDCQIIDEDYRKILSCTLAYFREKETPFYHKLTHQGYLRHLLVRKAVKTGEILVDLITTTQTPPFSACMEEGLLQDWRKQLLDLKLLGTIVGILHTFNDSLSDTVQNDRTECLYGQNYFYEELLGLKFKISPFSFFQTNSLGAEVLYDTAREYVTLAGINKEKADRQTNVIYDLYSGTGTIAQLLAPVAKKVIGVEIVEEAVEAAKQNAALNGLHNCEFIAGDVLKVLDEIEEKPDFIVLDPPRDGIHPKALKKIIHYGVENIVYISCKPTSLVRDLEVFLACGYEVMRACAIDQFPGTGHVESIVLLQRKS